MFLECYFMGGATFWPIIIIILVAVVAALIIKAKLE